MGLWELGFAVYVLVTVFAFVMTWREQTRTGLRSPLYNALGYLACTLWPAVVAVLLVEIHRQKA